MSASVDVGLKESAQAPSASSKENVGVRDPANLGFFLLEFFLSCLPLSTLLSSCGESGELGLNFRLNLKMLGLVGFLKLNSSVLSVFIGRVNVISSILISFRGRFQLVMS